MRAFVREAATWIGQSIKRPDNWGGFAVTPFRFEFWQGREKQATRPFPLFPTSGWQLEKGEAGSLNTDRETLLITNKS